MNRRNTGRSALQRVPTNVHKCTLVVLLILAVNFTLPVHAAQEMYRVDGVHSGVSFKVRHLLSYTSGRFTDFNGILNYDEAKPERSQIEFTINTASQWCPTFLA